MQYAIIENNTIINVAEADAPLAENWEPLQADAGIGWARTEPGMPFEAPAPAPSPAPSPVPPPVTMRQARLALLGAGLLDDVEAAIAALPSPQKEAARIEWEYATEVQRSSGLVPMMGAALGLDDAALDGLLIEAAAL